MNIKNDIIDKFLKTNLEYKSLDIFKEVLLNLLNKIKEIKSYLKPDKEHEINFFNIIQNYESLLNTFNEETKSFLLLFENSLYISF